MVDINVVVANNIIDLMKKNHTKQKDLAVEIGVSKQIMSKMLNGSRMISIAELHKIAEYYHVKMDDLLKQQNIMKEGDVVKAFMGKVSTDAARDALKMVDELADMIVYHANIRENSSVMSETWEM
ncbi:DNA-binding transcriptional regulator, XRE-family HTH domain [Pseudobutyrivibrio sp. UC1225]|uniref:helix-turn-helix domain-containing protein n=1 Tax=Pseudobutyrivibrio sp. UC1225 TaxID=1798185 RepID=UPI0008EFCA1E|nr:helix-turn-helix transcriptional regulator [Pseudobutyrivibrio sp. UC1225]SFO29984.1 DNA-binding transcriptional regulator, XRE-family HTH domain [Pseudobutyrivibrio sp. UC1225]